MIHKYEQIATFDNATIYDREDPSTIIWHLAKLNKTPTKQKHVKHGTCFLCNDDKLWMPIILKAKHLVHKKLLDSNMRYYGI